MCSINSKFERLKVYSENIFKNKVLEGKQCYEGLYGESQPILILRTLPLPEKFHLVFSTPTKITHYSIPNTQLFPEITSTDSLANYICFEPNANLLSNCLTEEFEDFKEHLFQVGNFVQNKNTLALTIRINPLKLILIRGDYPKVESENLLEILDNIKKYFVKEVKVEKFYKTTNIKIHRLPFMISKMNSALKSVNCKLNNNFKSLRDHMETKFPKNEKHFINKYYQGPQRTIKYLLTIIKNGFIFSRFSIYFAFKSLKECHYFKCGSYPTLEKAKNKYKSISSKLISGKFQDKFRNGLEVFKNYSRSELPYFSFRVGDCLLRPTHAIGNTINLYYHHGIFIGCENSCEKFKHCRSCKNVFHITGGQHGSGSSKDSSKSRPKGHFFKIKIEEILGDEIFLRIKRNKFIRLTKEQYHEKANNFINNFNAAIKLKIPLDKELDYNFLFNNCGHIVNRFENKESDMGPDNKNRIKAVLGFIMTTIVIVAGTVVMSATNNPVETVKLIKTSEVRRN